MAIVWVGDLKNEYCMFNWTYQKNSKNYAKKHENTWKCEVLRKRKQVLLVDKVQMRTSKRKGMGGQRTKGLEIHANFFFK